MLVTNNAGLPFFSASLGELVETLRAHAVEREPALPPPAMVVFYPIEKAFGVTTVGPGLAGELSEVMAWSRSLQRPKGLWCRQAGGTLLVFVEGRISDGTRAVVGGGGPYGECQGLVTLPVGGSQRVTVDALDELTTQLRVATSGRPALPPAGRECYTWAEVARLTDALDAHLTGLPVQMPTPFGLSFSLGDRSIRVDAGGPNLVLALSILLPWTYSLGDGSIFWKRTPKEHSDDELMIEVHSHLPGDIPTTVVAEVPYKDCVDVIELAACQVESVSLATLDAVWEQIDPSDDLNRYKRKAARRRRRKTDGAARVSDELPRREQHGTTRCSLTSGRTELIHVHEQAVPGPARPAADTAGQGHPAPYPGTLPHGRAVHQ